MTKFIASIFTSREIFYLMLAFIVSFFLILKNIEPTVERIALKTLKKILSPHFILKILNFYESIAGIIVETKILRRLLYFSVSSS